MILGLDLSRRDVACVLAKNDGATVLALRATLPVRADTTAQWRALIELAQETMIRSMQPRAQITTAVLAMDARFDANGKIEKSAHSDGWMGFDLIAGLRENLHIETVQIHNRVVCESAGETRFGALRDTSQRDVSSVEIAVNATQSSDALFNEAHFNEAQSPDATSSTRSSLFVHIGASLGAAFFDGRQRRFVDIGEIVIERDGALGSGGRRGTTEAYCSEENFLARAASYGVTLRQESEVWEMAKSNFAAQSLRDDFMRRLCQALGVAWTILQPEKIVLGGSLAISLGDELLHSVRRGIHEFCALSDETTIINGALGHDDAVLGAVALGADGQEARGDSINL